MFNDVCIYLVDYKNRMYVDYCLLLSDLNGNHLKSINSMYGKIKLTLKNKNFYKLTFKTKYGLFEKTIYVNSTINNIFVYINDKKDRLSATFFLTDKNYINLPIQKGVIYLWANHTV